MLWLPVSTPSRPGQLHWGSRFSCKLLTSIIVEKGYFIRAIVKDPLLHTGGSTEVTSEFKHSNHPAPQKFIFSILYHLGEGKESDWIVSASTAWHEQCSLNTSKCRLLFQTLLMRRNNCSVGY